MNPSEVQINSGHEVFLAQPVITPIERLRRKDKEVARALEEKQRLIEEILNIPHEELESITESANINNMGQQQPRTAAEILLSALSQAWVNILPRNPYLAKAFYPPPWHLERIFTHGVRPRSSPRW